MMKVTLRSSSLIFGLFLWSFAAWAQPANDMCSGAITITIGADEASAVRVNGDTRGTEDASADGIPVCSGNFYRDDVWYTLNLPDTASNAGYNIKVYYTGTGTDIPAFGIALYYSCDADDTNQPFICSNTPADDLVKVIKCVEPGQTIYIRVWSAAGDATNWEAGEGTFQIAAYAREPDNTNSFNVLWGNETGEGDFAGGLNNWTT
ncbi:MAG TPA: hypothetical protein VN763_00275, partial [Saprospiraceae bacterium]|nr:hypothetical protein [Saprospiraceae bacterium]